MKVEYNNLYTHFVFTTLNRMPVILEQHRQRIEKLLRGLLTTIIVNYMLFTLIRNTCTCLYQRRQVWMKKA